MLRRDRAATLTVEASFGWPWIAASIALDDPNQLARMMFDVAYINNDGVRHGHGIIDGAAKDASDPAWKDDPAMKAWSSFMDKYYPDGDKDDSNAVFGYAAAETLFQVLSQCGNDLSRENIMRQSASLRRYQNSVALPGITFNTGPADFHPIKQMRLVQFDGTCGSRSVT